MSNKDKVKEVFPRAYAEKHIERNPLSKSSYYLVWSTRLREEKVRLGEGKTEAQAWKDAWENYKQI